LAGQIKTLSGKAMAPEPKKPPTGRTERKYLIAVLVIIVVATVVFFGIRQFTPPPAEEVTHGGPDPMYSAPPAITPTLPEEGEDGQALREMRPDALRPGGEVEPEAPPPAGEAQPPGQPQPATE
jgi:hypothetical protein